MVVFSEIKRCQHPHSTQIFQKQKRARREEPAFDDLARMRGQHHSWLHVCTNASADGNNRTDCYRELNCCHQYIVVGQAGMGRGARVVK